MKEITHKKTPGPSAGKGKAMTVVLIPHHGENMFQWRVPHWAWWSLLGLALSLVAGSVWVMKQHVHYEVELSRLAEEREANQKLTTELLGAKEAVLRVGKMDLELRRMLQFGSAKALFSADSIGGPSDEDVRHLSEMLGTQASEAAKKAEKDMQALVLSAKDREKSFNEIRNYVETKRSLQASKPSSWPVHGWVSSKFGARMSPVSGEKGYHAGVDIANDMGSPVRATADGRVSYAGWEGGYGKLVVVRHGHGFDTYYGHLSEIKASVNQQVRRGTVIGLMGQTGDATGPHVHYEIRVFGAAVNPVKFMR
ncbi:MAG: M23 family metallopeptidase [candidate division FCPU426 bacterium]